VGLVVADRWQRRGVGSALLGALITEAAAREVQVLVMDVLPENRRMQAIIGRRWPGARRQSGPDFITFLADLGGGAAAGQRCHGTHRAA
jgi:GNAT superfamily N-acetyltransferase